MRACLKHSPSFLYGGGWWDHHMPAWVWAREAHRKAFAFQPSTPRLAKALFVEVAKLFVHNGKLKFHFHMKLVNNGFQDSLNKHAQDTVSIVSLYGAPAIWMKNKSVMQLLWGHQGQGMVRAKCMDTVLGLLLFTGALLWPRFVTSVIPCHFCTGLIY